MQKNSIYLITFVDRTTRCILSRSVDYSRSSTVIKIFSTKPCKEAATHSGYQTVLYWPATHYPMPDKRETYSVEGDNAELRHYLTRLAQKSRCFSRSEKAFRCAIKLFVFAFNKRQLYKQKYPQYPARLIDFVCPQL